MAKLRVGKGMWWVIPGCINCFKCFLAKKFLFFKTNWRQRNFLVFWMLYPLGFTWCSALSLTHQKADSLEPHQEKARILNHWKSSLHCKREQQSNGLCDMADLESIAHQGRKECHNCKGIWLLFLELFDWQITMQQWCVWGELVK